jgi:antirestriction protein ArdC
MSTDINESITDRIIESLERGVAPWRSPYLVKYGVPSNFSTGKKYSGVNVWLLSLAGFASPYWLTYKQAQELGGNVRKGEKGCQVVKYGTFERENPQGEVKKSMYLKSYTVFNACQIDGIDFPKPEAREVVADLVQARAIIDGMPNKPEVRHGSANAFYSPAGDFVSMPNPENVASDEAYFSTFFHELVHATGAANRLNRKTLVENKGVHNSRQTYAEEELVAEMGAAFLNAEAGILESELENSAAYLQSWIKALKSGDAKTWIIRASSQAQKAANYILGV